MDDPRVMREISDAHYGSLEGQGGSQVDPVLERNPIQVHLGFPER